MSEKTQYKRREAIVRNVPASGSYAMSATALAAYVLKGEPAPENTTLPFSYSKFIIILIKQTAGSR